MNQHVKMCYFRLHGGAFVFLKASGAFVLALVLFNQGVHWFWVFFKLSPLVAAGLCRLVWFILHNFYGQRRGRQNRLGWYGSTV